ncbi:MAG: HPr family phosphocarrier protein [Deltaproteobacteria bacterium]|nr:HPr family phosphocarrier protein [Deltaproteobacteria bacterium]
MEHKRKLKIINDLGIHARSAARIVELAGRHTSRLYLKKDGHEEVEGDSILSILTLNCPKGTELGARAVGEDSLALLNELVKLFEDRFGEDR